MRPRPRPSTRTRAAAARLALRVLSSVVVVVVLVMSRSARARSPERERAEAAFARAEQEDAALELARALAGYEEARTLDPGFARAARAEARSAELRAHSEGDLLPLTKLERIRREPALSSSAKAIDELVLEAERFPEGLVRIEAWVLAAEAYAHRLGRPADADALLRRVLVEPRTDRAVGQTAARELVALQLARGDLAAADAARRLAGSRADPQLARVVSRALRRRWLHRASVAILTVIVLMAARACAFAARRGSLAAVRHAVKQTSGIAAAYAAYVALGGALLASGYEAGTARPFLSFGAALVPIVLLARAWAAAGASHAAARHARASLCGLGAVAAAFLVLETVDVTFLEGMGL